MNETPEERIYQTLKYWIDIFNKAIKEKESMRPFWETDIDPKLHQAELDGMRAKLKELEDELANGELAK